MIGILSASGARDRRIAALRAPVAPSWSVNPSLLSVPTEGLSTAADLGTYDGTQPITYAFQWQTSTDGVGDADANVGTDSSTSPVWSAGQAGGYARVTVTLTNAAGSTSYSTAWDQVEAASPPGTGTATLTWVASEDTAVTGYKVFWGSTPWAETYNSGTISGRTTATYTATGLESGRLYFKIRPLFAGGEGEDYSLGYVDIA